MKMFHLYSYNQELGEVIDMSLLSIINNIHVCLMAGHVMVGIISGDHIVVEFITRQTAL